VTRSGELRASFFLSPAPTVLATLVLGWSVSIDCARLAAELLAIECLLESDACLRGCA
jgi:hypothetical protein